MSWKIVKNPDTQNYQIFSSIVDAFLLDNELTREEIDEFWLNEFGEKGQDNYKQIMSEFDKSTGKWLNEWKTVKMWDTHQVEHGPKNRQPDICDICKDILNDEVEDAKKFGK